MLHRLLPVCLLAAAFAAANGCCHSRPFVSCGAGVSDSCGTGDDCDCASCGLGHRGCGLGNGLRNCLTCKSGCGDVYWGDWINHPPCCDPCDDGDWVGDACCPPWGFPLLRGLHALWGARYYPGASGVGYGYGSDVVEADGGCESCAASAIPEPTRAAPKMQTPEKVVPPQAEPEAPGAKKATGASHRFKHATYAKPQSQTPAKQKKKTRVDKNSETSSERRYMLP